MVLVHIIDLSAFYIHIRGREYYYLLCYTIYAACVIPLDYPYNISLSYHHIIYILPSVVLWHTCIMDACYKEICGSGTCNQPVCVLCPYLWSWVLVRCIKWVFLLSVLVVHGVCIIVTTKLSTFGFEFVVGWQKIKRITHLIHRTNTHDHRYGHKTQTGRLHVSELHISI